jgi:dsDNA-specific endonuclease/ATPase MutS2
MTTTMQRLFKWLRTNPIEPVPEEPPLAEDEDPFTEPVVWEITDTIDLHRIAPREIEAVVQAYLEETYARGFRCVRIIHGKGIGVQREAVRRLLARTAFVEIFSDAPDASGWGATVVRFAGAGKK